MTRISQQPKPAVQPQKKKSDAGIIKDAVIVLCFIINLKLTEEILGYWSSRHTTNTHYWPAAATSPRAAVVTTSRTGSEVDSSPERLFNSGAALLEQTSTSTYSQTSSSTADVEALTEPGLGPALSSIVASSPDGRTSEDETQTSRRPPQASQALAQRIDHHQRPRMPAVHCQNHSGHQQHLPLYTLGQTAPRDKVTSPDRLCPTSIAAPLLAGPGSEGAAISYGLRSSAEVKVSPVSRPTVVVVGSPT